MGIFNTSEVENEPDTADVPKAGKTQSAQSKNVSVIGPTLVFKGELSADEDLIIEGHVEGTIAHHKKHLTVGKHGRVKADIHASSVIVLGQVVGNIHSDGIVSLSRGADVTGDISCSRITMEEGARFKGNIDMGEPVAVTAQLANSPSTKKTAVVEAVRKEISPAAAGQTAKSSVL